MITWDGYVQLALKFPKPSHRFCLLLNPADITLRMVFIIRLQIHVHNYIEHVDLGSVINPRACMEGYCSLSVSLSLSVHRYSMPVGYYMYIYAYGVCLYRLSAHCV